MKSAAGENRKPTQWAPRVAQGKSAQPWVCCGENRKPTQWATESRRANNDVHNYGQSLRLLAKRRTSQGCTELSPATRAAGLRGLALGYTLAPTASAHGSHRPQPRAA
jgi:hypothetical protein